jgi:hypothetical protein
MNIPNLDQRTFYATAVWLFIISIFGSSWSLYQTWNNLNMGSKIYSCSTLLFQVLLLWFFYSLFVNSPKPIKFEQQNEIDRIIEEFSKEKKQ